MVDRLGQQCGNYRLVSLLGQGGYAEVYLGQHVRFNQQAAIKVLHAHLSEQEAEHFHHEAETIATLAHPSIIRVLDFDVQQSVPFLVIDYAPNGSLRQRYPKGSLVPLPVIVSIVKQMAAALQYAHDKKFIHRDVKPENMLIGQHQEVLLSDFGIATIAHSTSSLNVSAEGASGTLAYMAPEQIEGHPRPASDQYALAVVVYEWLCGERPFEGSVSEVMAQHLSVPPPSLRERVPAISPEIEQVVLRALAKDPKARFASVADFAIALEQASQRVLSSTAKHADEQPAFGSGEAQGYGTVLVEPGQPKPKTESTPSADLPVGVLESTIYPDASTPHGLDSPPSKTPKQGQLLAPTAAVVSPPLEPTMPVKRKARHVSRPLAGLLIGLVVLVVAGGILVSLSLLAHFGVSGSRSGVTTVVRGGAWTDDSLDPDSLIPNGGSDGGDMDWVLYLPLFYGDAQGMVHPGAAREIPSLHNGGIGADATTWTFRLRPGLVWSDGQPYDARDVDYTWQLWLNPKFGAGSTQGFNLISSADVSADHLSITFHLKHAYAAFLSYWVDGDFAPLPAHHYGSMSPEQILKSSDNLNPSVTSGPFMMAESVPGDHYTLVRNPRYYRASEGLPYLDKVVFRSVEQDARLKNVQAGTSTSGWYLDVSDVSKVQAYRRLSGYRLVTSPANDGFEAMWFNFHNTVLATHPEVRQAMAMAIDHQALITQARQGFATPLCTDHPSALHPGYELNANCPEFDPALANQLLSDNGWVKGSDGVRARDGQRLSFEYSACAACDFGRLAAEAILERNFQAIGIKLDIHNYPGDTFFGSLLPGGKASPPTGAVPGRYDIVEWAWSFGYDPDDSTLLACDQIPPNGGNSSFYCNPALDALYTQELATADPGERQQIFTKIHQLLLTQFPLIVLYSPTDLTIVRKGTHNYLPSPFQGETADIWEWWCDGGKC
jgi:ABC-type transport system substrate-binding protein/serine/threonine protein kinase